MFASNHPTETPAYHHFTLSKFYNIHFYLAKDGVANAAHGSCGGHSPLTAAAAAPGLADLFLVPLSATGSSSTSLSALELRLLGPLGFSTAALQGTDRTDGGRKEDGLLLRTQMWDSRLLCWQEGAVFPALPQILSIFIPTPSLRRHDHCSCVSLQRYHVKIHTLGLS